MSPVAAVVKKPDASVPMRVGNETNVVSLASSISHCLRAHAYAELTAIGEKQGYLALKACAIAQTFVAKEPWTLVVSPGFFEKPNERRPGGTLTGLRLQIRRSHAAR